jgi:hypothetical protein
VRIDYDLNNNNNIQAMNQFNDEQQLPSTSSTSSLHNTTAAPAFAINDCELHINDDDNHGEVREYKERRRTSLVFTETPKPTDIPNEAIRYACK